MKVAPPSVLSCHCTGGTGVPLAAAVKLTLPGQIVWLDGLSVINGPLLSVSVAAVVATLLVQALLKRARFRLPLSAATAVKLKVVLVAPSIPLKLTPPSVMRCHSLLGALPTLAAAVKLTLPGQIVWLDGLSVINGPLLSVSVAAVVATLLVQALLKRARYSLPLSAATAVKLKVDRKSVA